MDSNRLRYFLIVKETGSIRKAAELLHLSPAALSKSVKQLEEECGFPLLIPSGRGIIISYEGKELARMAKPLVEGIDQLASLMREGKTAEQGKTTIRLGSFEVFTTHFLSPLLSALPEPSEILLRELIPGAMEKALVDREIDYGITYIPIPTNSVEHVEVAKIEMGIFCSKEKHAVFSKLPIEALPFAIPIQPISGAPNKVQGLDGWPEDKVSRNAKYRVTLMESALELVRKGSAIAYLPTFIVELHNETVKPKYQLQRLTPPKGLTSQRQGVFLARRRSDAEGDTFKKLAKALRITCKG